MNCQCGSIRKNQSLLLLLLINILLSMKKSRKHKIFWIKFLWRGCRPSPPRSHVHIGVVVRRTWDFGTWSPSLWGRRENLCIRKPALPCQILMSAGRAQQTFHTPRHEEKYGRNLRTSIKHVVGSGCPNLLSRTWWNKIKKRFLRPS